MKIEEKRKIGSRFKSIRKQQGLTQSAFAKKLGIKTEAYKKIETGANSPTATILAACRSEFNVSIDWLLTGASEIPDFGMFQGRVNDMLEAMGKHDNVLFGLLSEYCTQMTRMNARHKIESKQSETG